MRALVVDGYNAIHKIPYLKRIMQRDLSQAREKITKLAKEYQRKSGGIDKVYVIFDGKDAYREEEPHSSPHHIFSRTGKGDEEVISVVRRLSERYQVEVVSDDNYVRNNSRAYKARVIEVKKFTSFLDKKQKVATRVQSKKKIEPQDALKINEALKKHWNF